MLRNSSFNPPPSSKRYVIVEGPIDMIDIVILNVGLIEDNKLIKHDIQAVFVMIINLINLICRPPKFDRPIAAQQLSK